MAGQINKEKTTGFGNQVPPTWEQVAVFFDQAGFQNAEAKKYYDHYQGTSWKGVKGNPIRNWKTKANECIWELKMLNPHLRFK
jgi:hypothetical protein